MGKREHIRKTGEDASPAAEKYADITLSLWRFSYMSVSTRRARDKSHRHSRQMESSQVYIWGGGADLYCGLP